MKLTRNLTLLALFALVILSSCTESEISQSVVQSPEVVKIGASFPLSGDVAFLGETSRNALEMALKELPSTKYKYELVFEDDKLDAKSAATAATKLISSDRVDAIISISSGTGNAITPVAEQNRVIHFGIASDANVAKGFYNFIHWTPPDEEAKAWASEAQKRGYKKVAIMKVQQQGAVAIINSAKKYLEGTDVKVVDEEVINPGDKDFRTLILKARQKKPDAYLLMLFSPELDLLYKQMREFGVKEPISGIESFELSNDPSQFEEQWYVNAADPSDEFTKKYEATFGKTPQLGAPNSYDIFKLIVHAYEAAGKDSSVKPSREAVVAELMKIRNFNGALGSLNVGEEGIVSSPAVVRTIKNGKPVTIRG